MMLTYASVLEIIENERWDELVGEAEGDSFDGKREIYDLSSDHKKMELAKDAASFANAAGGIIIVGIETQKSALHFSDEVVSLKPFGATIFNPEQYRDVLNSWVYPKINNLKIEWKEESPETNRGFGIITVPPQPEEVKPFLVTQTIHSSGKRSDILFGYAERKLDISSPATIFELHQLLRDGLRYNKLLSARFDALEARLRINEQTRPHPQIEIKTRIQELLKVNDLGTSSHFVLAAYPSNPSELPDFFNAKSDSIVKRLEKPPITRENGFVVIRSGIAKIVAGELWRVGDDGRKVVDLYPDGVLVFGCLAGEWFLGWGTQESRINTLVLAEVVYNFCLLYGEVIKEFLQLPDRLHFRFEFGNMHPTDGKPKIYIVPHEMGGFWPSFPDEGNSAPRNSGEGEIQIPGDEFDPAVVAFKIVEKIYNWFSFTSDSIPYTEEVDGQRKISESQFKSQR